MAVPLLFRENSQGVNSKIISKYSLKQKTFLFRKGFKTILGIIFSKFGKIVLPVLFY